MEEEEIEEDFNNIAKALKLLSMDYLGGHGSRGYGKVAFSDFEVEQRSGDSTIDTSKLLEILKGVEDYGIFALQA